jgi:hypothetical protein
MSREQQLRRIAEDMFNSETRRGWIANNCSAAGDVDPNITQQKYVERFIERNKDHDIDELLECADIARPSNMLTAHEKVDSEPGIGAKMKWPSNEGDAAEPQNVRELLSGASRGWRLPNRKQESPQPTRKALHKEKPRGRR